jgi:hypothetical protein
MMNEENRSGSYILNTSSAYTDLERGRRLRKLFIFIWLELGCC